MLPFGEIAYSYDARGLVSREQRKFALTGAGDSSTSSSGSTAPTTRSASSSRSTWDDGQKWRLGYDTRGLDADRRVVRPRRERVEAGSGVRPLGRRTAAGSRASFGQMRRYTYDALGRVAGTRSDLWGETAPIAPRTYGFTDSGDVQYRDRSDRRRLRLRELHVRRPAPADRRLRPARLHRLVHVLSGRQRPDGRGHVERIERGTERPLRVRPRRPAGRRSARRRLGRQRATPSSLRPRRQHDRRARLPTAQTSLEWDGRDRIRVAQTPAGRETYFYDHTGARMLAVGDRGTRFWFGESETHSTSPAHQTHRYLHLSDGGSTVARVENRTTIELQYSDTLQNLMLALDATAKRHRRASTTGRSARCSVLPGEPNHRRQFNGKENDALTGLRYYGYRYYDPLALRWNSADPLYRVAPDLGLAEPQRMNLYTFSLNNPVRYYDPDGRDPEQSDEGSAEICEAPDDAEATCDLAGRNDRGERADR